MSLITNRKRPRGFSETFDTHNQSKTSNANPNPNAMNESNETTQNKQLFDNISSSSGSTYNDSPTQYNLNSSSSTLINQSDGKIKPKQPKNDLYIVDNDSDVLIDDINRSSSKDEEAEEEEDEEEEDDDDEEEEEDDDVIILEERQILPPRADYQVKTRRNNSDSILIFDHDAFAAYNMFNVNNRPDNNHIINNMTTTTKKQRTNSLPQLPQAKCFYNKIPNNYILQHSKLGDIKTNIIPHKLNLPPCDDKDGHYIIRINENFTNRFTITKLLGQGTFGKVVECYDKVNREKVAIKIIRNIPKYRDAARIELRILSTLKRFDNENVNHCIHLRECFDFRGHICIVTDLLKISLYDFLDNNKFIPYPGSHIQAIAKQLIRSVTFLHDLNLIHTDLKPENILLHDDSFVRKNLISNSTITAYIYLNVNNLIDGQQSMSKMSSSLSSSSISSTISTSSFQSNTKFIDLTNNEQEHNSNFKFKTPPILPPNYKFNEKNLPNFTKVLKNPLIQIIDFGSAIFNDEYHLAIVSTRHYRAPEIVLGTGWSFPCDMWSIGCILVEFVIGEPLFRTHDNLEHLAMIEKIVGSPIDKAMVKLLKRKENECGIKYFSNAFETDYDDLNSDSNESDVIIDDELNESNSLRLIFPSSSTSQKFIDSVAQLSRIDFFISHRIGLDINFDYSLSENFTHNQNVINFGNFTFWWFFIDLLRKLFIINPDDRLTAAEAMEHPWFNLGIEDEGTL